MLPDPEETRRAVGRVVADVRIRRGWTQQELAARASISQNGISEIEAARRGVTFITFLKLAAALDMPPVEFLGEVLGQVGASGPLPRLGRRS